MDAHDSNNSNNNKRDADDDDSMEDVSILEDDAQQRLPTFVIAPEDEARFNSLLPPVHHVVVPVRRRAHTVDVECAARVQQDKGPSGPCCNEDDDDDDRTVASLSSLEEELCEPEVVGTSSSFRLRRLSLSEEGRQRRRRKKLLNSRCVRGFAALCVYGVLVLQPSTTTLMDTAVPKPIEVSQAPLVNNNNATTTLAVDSNRRAQQQTKMKLAALPKFHSPKRPLYYSTMPPNAIHSITKTNGTVTRWHKIPPDPPTIYHKKQRPILSHAHSYQLHQEPLVFGREQKTSFLLDDASDDEWNVPWMNSLIWLSLVCLLMDTSYREWQHYQWHRRVHFGMGRATSGTSTNLSALQRRQRRSLHYRRSPSPEPTATRRRRRFDSF